MLELNFYKNNIKIMGANMCGGRERESNDGKVIMTSEEAYMVKKQ